VKYYKRITCFENNRRVEKLSEFRELVLEYFKNRPASVLVKQELKIAIIALSVKLQYHAL